MGEGRNEEAEAAHPRVSRPEMASRCGHHYKGGAVKRAGGSRRILLARKPNAVPDPKVVQRGGR